MSCSFAWVGLSDEEAKERQQLLDEGFGEWNRRHFQEYIRACERFGRGFFF